MAAVLTERDALAALADHCLTEACCRRNPDPKCPQADALHRVWRRAWKEGRR